MWVKNCPECDCVQHYKYRGDLTTAKRLNSKCKSCSYKGRVYSKEHNRKISESRKGTKCSEETKRKLSKANKGRIYSEEHNKKISLAKTGKKRAPFSDECRKRMSESHVGLKHTNSTKKKQRLTAINRIEEQKGQMMPNYNPSACLIFDQLNEKNNWKLQHAENGGEYKIPDLGYFVDAIDFKNKIIIEYDEKWIKETN